MKKLTQVYLIKILDSHLLFLKGEEGGVKADLSFSDLSGVDLSYANLSGANLSGANVRDSDLRYADLRGANLSKADLSFSILRGADLRNANLRDAYLRDADITGANLRYSDLNGINLIDIKKMKKLTQGNDENYDIIGDIFFLKIIESAWEECSELKIDTIDKIKIYDTELYYDVFLAFTCLSYPGIGSGAAHSLAKFRFFDDNEFSDILYSIQKLDSLENFTNKHSSFIDGYLEIRLKNFISDKYWDKVLPKSLKSTNCNHWLENFKTQIRINNHD